MICPFASERDGTPWQDRWTLFRTPTCKQPLAVLLMAFRPLSETMKDETHV
jgi:hypothetical protein